MTDQTAPPANAMEARTRLDARIADGEWGARVMNGDPAAKKELHELSVMVAGSSSSSNDVVAAVMNGTAGQPGQAGGMFTNSEHAQMAATAGLFRDFGIRDEVISEFLSGKKVTKEAFDATVNWKKVAMGTKDFVDRYLSGDKEAGQKMLLADSILTNGYEESAA